MCCTFSLFATMIRREVPKDVIYIYKATKAVVRNREPLFLGQPWHHPLLLPGEDSLGIIHCCYPGRTALASSNVARNSEPLFLKKLVTRRLLLPR